MRHCIKIISGYNRKKVDNRLYVTITIVKTFYNRLTETL